MIDSIRGKLLSCIFARNYGKGGGWEDGEKHPGLIRLIGKRLYCESGKVKIRTALPPTPSTLLRHLRCPPCQFVTRLTERDWGRMKTSSPLF
ncbi:hypothetical protein CEXT_35721 [Caerostris extrusa]|uniref:Uncharacterized protein n=1 Tax=Caerostris extrusa TaxID=172846 RepID=A0AAV4P0J6_CAEEX|nr:hypothetical protein CEXT_35721 [Caerostris extrusa]